MTPEQLKASILQYAVEGKLVKQDPNDEPASELLKNIEKEKSRLVEEGKIKKSKKLPTIADDEKPFDIPDNWEWVRLDSLALVLNGDRGKNYPGKQYWISEGVPFINAGALGEKNINKSKINYISEQRFNLLRAGFIKNNDILYCLRGSLGKMSISRINRGAIASSVCIIRLFDDQILNYIWIVLNSEFGKYLIKEFENGTAQPNLSANNIKKYYLPIPPLEEQKRIVAKIEKLLPLVDEYAESYNRFQKIDNEFEDKLKQSVLQYAMEGKLVKQNSSDEPASELIKKIENEKAELIKEGKIKKSKKLPAITDDEKPFDIPDSWEWVRLGDIVQAQIGKTPQRHNSDYWTERDIPWVSIADLTNGNLTETKEKISSKALKDVFHDRIVAKNTLLMSFKLTIGKVAILRINAVHNEAIVSIIPFIDSEHSLRDYLFVTLPMISQNGDFKDAIKGKTLNKSSLTKLLIPLPPLKEQKRIVAKLREFKRSADILSK
ncbi:restriction endonuclease subunit S [Lactobacillus gallinarum]|uniref:restriction endonuclease subunit S n=1 Tax=Lactobacillus gallinarum TaxID=52242 RepID=UPI0024BA043A|nr:restriction endonuclease subunit S [Lactobacillus gallinarum]